jgi:hypothetical protein
VSYTEFKDLYKKINISQTAEVEEIVNTSITSGYYGNPRSYNVIHPSTIGGCIRKAVMDSLYLTRSVPSPRELRVFDNGHHLHKRIEDYFEDSCMLVERELRLEYPELNVFGNTDALINIYNDNRLVELKSMKQSAFDYMVTKKKKPSESYVVQLQLYMHLINKIFKDKYGYIKYGYIIAECKDNQEWVTYLMEYNPEFGIELEDRIRLINQCVSAGKLPDVEYYKGAFPCSWKNYTGKCGYFNYCFSCS